MFPAISSRCSMNEELSKVTTEASSACIAEDDEDSVFQHDTSTFGYAVPTGNKRSGRIGVCVKVPDLCVTLVCTRETRAIHCWLFLTPEVITEMVCLTNAGYAIPCRCRSCNGYGLSNTPSKRRLVAVLGGFMGWGVPYPSETVPKDQSFPGHERNLSQGSIGQQLITIATCVLQQYTYMYSPT